MRNFKSLAALAVMLAAGAANAALPDGVTTSVTAAGTDGLAVVGALAAAGASVFLIGKVLRKFGLMI